jgi:hypothetical protein
VNEAFNELHNKINCTGGIYDPSTISLMPNEPIILTHELNITFLFTTISAKANEFNIAGVSGINVYPWPSFHGPKLSTTDLSLDLSILEFYVNNTPPGEYTCGPGLIPDDSSKSVSLFSAYLFEFFINYGNTYGSASQSVCPFVFKYANIPYFTFNYQVDSFLFVSLLRFEEINLSTISSINSTISALIIKKSYNYKLDEARLHPLVFANIHSLSFEGTIKSIQTGLFKTATKFPVKFYLFGKLLP